MRDKITDTSVATLQRTSKNSAKAIFLWDTELKGFGVRSSPQGQLSWVYNYWLGGKEKRLTFQATDASDARLQCHQYKVDVSKGIDLVGRKMAQQDGLVFKMDGDTLAQAMEKYLGPNTGNSRYWVQQRNMFNEVLNLLGQDKLLSNVTKQNVRSLLDLKQDQGKAAMARYVFATLSPFFRWCVERDLIAVSPIADLSRPERVDSRDRVLSDKEIINFWFSTETVGWIWGAYYRLLLLTGQRRDEVAGMSWFELNLSERTWTIPKQRTKNNKFHIVHLSPLAMDVLASVPKSPRSQYLFSKTSTTPISGFSKSKGYLDAVMETDTPWRVHDLRRTMASGLAKLGVEPHVTERVLNHISGSQSGIQGVYQRYEYLPERKEAVEKWSVYINDLVNNG